MIVVIFDHNDQFDHITAIQETMLEGCSQTHAIGGSVFSWW